MKKMLLIGLQLLVASAAIATVINVPDGQPTIQAGIDAASEGDTVLVACGSYYEHDIVMRAGITLRGATGAADCVVIDAQQLGRVMDFDAEPATPPTLIEGITFTGGQADQGAGLRGYTCDVILRRCAFVSNTASGSGGGMRIHFGRYTLEDCEFRENSAFAGGGLSTIYCWPGSAISGCIFAGNLAAQGGGYHDDDDDFPILGSVFSGNQADAGGAIFVTYAYPQVLQCTIAENAATSGSGLFVSEAGGVTIESSIFAFGEQGQAIDSDAALPEIELQACDVFGNAGGDWVGPIAGQLGANCNFSLDPQFCGVLGSGDYTLQSDSPCTAEHCECGLLIGALPVGCGEVLTPSSSLSAIKALY